MTSTVDTATEPLVAAIESVRRPDSRLILLAPTGRRFDQRMALDRFVH